MTRRRIHAPHPDLAKAALLWTLCNRFAHDEAHLASEPSPVTCSDCLRRLEAAEESPFGFQPGAPVEGIRRGAHVLDAASVRAMARREVPPDACPWASSAEGAVRRYVQVRDEGASLRSTCDPSRANRVQTSSDPSLGGREHDSIERVASVAKALEHALRLPLAINAACPVVTPRQALDIYLLSVAGRRHRWDTRTGGKAWVWKRQEMSTECVVNELRDFHDLEVSHEQVRALRHLFSAVVADWLRETGELRGAERPAEERGERRPRRGSFRAAMIERAMEGA